MNQGYETVIGLEVHIQLRTRSKAYSPDDASYGGLPNTHIHPISLGLPGTLPVVNQDVIAAAVKLGLATSATIRRENAYARKNYFYADLPKGYQITQDTTPICNGGRLEFRLEDGTLKQVGLERIHMEEDAGKSMHDQDPFDSLIDLNRAGVPLLEMVSKPDLRSAREAYLYLSEVRRLVRHLEICDGNMEEGSLRCDANVSIRPMGQVEFGTKVEVKNMNSMRHVQKAIEFETIRQIQAIESGETIRQETRTFDATTGTTISMRTKEAANDYRYFPEPDIPPFFLEASFVQAVQDNLPPLPQTLYAKYLNAWGLSEPEALLLIDNKEEALYLEALVLHCKEVKTAANWVLGKVKSYLNETGTHIQDFPISPQILGQLIGLVENRKISHTAAAGPLWEALLQNPSKNPLELVSELNLLQESDTNALNALIDEVLGALPTEVARYKEGKTGLLGMFMGKVMQASGGKADPKIASKLIQDKLNP